MTIALILVIVALAFAYWYWRRRRIEEAVEQFIRDQERERNRFHCVEIRGGGQACDLAKQRARIRYLSAEAPRLPLEGCTAASCACCFVHHDDRRVEERRHAGGTSTRIPPKAAWEERRRPVDRRRDSGRAFKPRIVA